MANNFTEILKQYWGYDSFRPMQLDIIESVMAGCDTLGLLPTGGGKSITFQVPAMAQEGICLVITPLIALMKDQVENLKQRGIKAIALHSGMRFDEIDVALDNAIYGNFKFLYCSPERLETDIFKIRVQQMQVSMLVVDEAHCISQWGYDFRPAYLKIADFRSLLPGVPVLALTATATPEVVTDIQHKLLFQNGKVVTQSFERANVAYVVRQTDDKLKTLLKIAQSIKGTGIVYVRSRNKTKEIAEFLNKNGLSADFYHAGLSGDDRCMKQDDWKQNKTKIIVATNAFGMGIDKPDVRFVVHIDLPESPEAYFQEAGRAGRDGKKAFAVLLSNNADELNLTKRTDVNFPEIETIRRVYQCVGSFLKVPYGGGQGMSFDFNMAEFCSTYKINSFEVFSSLKLLEQYQYLELSDEMENPSRVMFTVGRDDLYRFQLSSPQADQFIRLLLRSYSALFDHQVKIDETVLAKRMNSNAKQISSLLIMLSKQRILNYIPRKKTPVLYYVTERLDDKNLYIPRSDYELRKQQYTRRSNSMLQYALDYSECRSRFLLRYFGQQQLADCGQCDVCLERKKASRLNESFDQIKQELKKQVLSEPQPAYRLLDKLNETFKEDDVVATYRWLLDNQQVIIDNQNRICWKSD